MRWAWGRTCFPSASCSPTAWAIHPTPATIPPYVYNLYNLYNATHSTNFFPTRFLWPISEARVNGVPWSKPVIFFPNVALLVVLYGWFLIKNRRRS